MKWITLAFALAFVSSPVLAQEVILVSDLEEEAKKLIEKAKALQKEGKYTEAADTFKTVLREYRILIFTNSIDEKEIKGYIRDCGLMIVGEQLQEPKLYKKKHIDSIYGLEFNPPDGWRGIPPQKMVTNKEAKRRSREYEQYYKTPMRRIALYYFPYLDELSLIVWKLEDVKSVSDIEGQFEKFLRSRVEDLSSGPLKPLKLRYPAATREFTSKETGNKMYTIYMHEARSKFGLVMMLSWDGLANESKASGTSTKVLDTKTVWDSVKELANMTARRMNIIPKLGLKSYRKKWNNGALCPGWRTIKTKNYFIEYATDKAFAVRLGEELELIHKVYKIAVPTRNRIPMCVVKAFASEEDFIAYSGARGAAAYWSPMQEEIVCYKFKGGEIETDTKDKKVIKTKEEATNVTFKIIYHEGFHQYTHYVMGHERMVYIPSWINEGLGDYFFGGQVTIKSGKKRFTIGLNDWRVETIYNAVKADKHVPFRQIFDYEQRDYYSKPGLCYAEGWAICYWLLNHEKKQYRMFPSLLIDTLRKEDDFRKATLAVKKGLGLDYDKMEEEWKAYVLETMKPPEKEEEKEEKEEEEEEEGE